MLTLGTFLVNDWHFHWIYIYLIVTVDLFRLLLELSMDGKSRKTGRSCANVLTVSNICLAETCYFVAIRISP